MDSPTFLDQRAAWMERAEALKPQLTRHALAPQSVIRIEHIDFLWQGCAAIPEYPAADLPQQWWTRGKTFLLDFGESVVGHIRLKVHAIDPVIDSPLHLRFFAAETPYELSADLGAYHGRLSRSWLQEEDIHLDYAPVEVTLPRRFSLRYLRVEVVAVPRAIRFDELCVECESAAPYELPPPPPGLDLELQAIDRASVRTLRNCMQSVFEDGPKRDRRLWHGDLRLQALANAVTYRNFPLVERCLWLLAGCTKDDGFFPSAVILQPSPVGSSRVLDYALLLGRTLLEHTRFSGSTELAKALYPLAVYQFDFFREGLGADGTFQNLRHFWVFLDHCRELDRQIPILACASYSLAGLAELAELLGHRKDARRFRAEAEAWRLLARKRLDPELHLLRSGDDAQLSVASQVWGILAGVLTPQEGLRALQALDEHPEAVQPVTPYMTHFYLEACRVCGDETRLMRHLRRYFGGMIARGADTFWEAYNEKDPYFSPYGDPLSNSCCHAWSSTPAWFLRQRP